MLSVMIFNKHWNELYFQFSVGYSFNSCCLCRSKSYQLKQLHMHYIYSHLSSCKHKTGNTFIWSVLKSDPFHSSKGVTYNVIFFFLHNFTDLCFSTAISPHVAPASEWTEIPLAATTPSSSTPSILLPRLPPLLPVSVCHYFLECKVSDNTKLQASVTNSYTFCIRILQPSQFAASRIFICATQKWTPK